MKIVLLSTLILLLISFLLLGVRVLFTSKGKFPDTHISGNKAMRERGIHCAQTQDREERKRKQIFDL